MGFVPGLSTAAFVETCTLSRAVESCVAHFWWKETPRVGVSDGTASYSQQSRPYLWVSLSYCVKPRHAGAAVHAASHVAVETFAPVSVLVKLLRSEGQP